MEYIIGVVLALIVAVVSVSHLCLNVTFNRDIPSRGSANTLKGETLRLAVRFRLQPDNVYRGRLIDPGKRSANY